MKIKENNDECKIAKEKASIQQRYKKIMRHRYAQFIPEMQSYLILNMSMDVLYHINGLVEVVYMLISRDAEKSFDKIQHPLITKTLAKNNCE